MPDTDTATVRTPEELRAQIDTWRDGRDDPLGFMVEAVLPYLPFEQAVDPPGLVKPEVAEEGKVEWEKGSKRLDRKTIVKQMRDYAEFGWGKIADERGISAGRTIQKMEAWLWLLGEDDLLETLRATDGGSYGRLSLAVVCEGMGFPVPEGAV